MDGHGRDSRGETVNAGVGCWSIKDGTCSSVWAFLASFTLDLGCCNGTRITIKRTEDVGASQDTLCPGVLEKGTNIDRRHHSPLSCFRLFDAEAFEKTGVKSSS